MTRNEKLRDHQGEDKAEQAIGRDNANKSPLQMRHWRRGFSRSLTARRRHHEQGAGHRREHGDHCKQQPVDAYGLSEGRQQAGSEYDEKRNPGARRSIQPSKAFAPYHGSKPPPKPSSAPDTTRRTATATEAPRSGTSRSAAPAMAANAPANAPKTPRDHSSLQRAKDAAHAVVPKTTR